MEENKLEGNIENNLENKGTNSQNNGPKQIAGAIIVAGFIIAGAILLKGSSAPIPQNPSNAAPVALAPAAVTSADRTLGDPKAKVTLIMYEDFQCPWCGKFVSESETQIRSKYVQNGSIELVFRDFPFLGTFVQPYVEAKDESINAAEAARCAGDQNTLGTQDKFWDYHDYIFAHQATENTGGFSIANLKSFAKTLGLDTTSFNQCLDSNKYAQAVADSKAEGGGAGVNGTPTGFILKSGKVVDTLGGYLPLATVTQKLDAALK